jgi:hypothetical protein
MGRWKETGAELPAVWYPAEVQPQKNNLPSQLGDWSVTYLELNEAVRTAYLARNPVDPGLSVIGKVFQVKIDARDVNCPPFCDVPRNCNKGIRVSLNYWNAPPDGDPHWYEALLLMHSDQRFGWEERSDPPESVEVREHEED